MRQALILMIFAGLAIAPRAEAGSFGVGAHYWRAIEDVDIDDIDDSGVSWVLSYQQPLGSLVYWKTELEIFTDDFAGISDTVFAPQVFLLAGHTLYGGVGLGVNYTDGEILDDPFYTLRVGLDFQITQSVALDLNANYIFMDWDDFDDTIDEIDGDTVTLGVALRFGGK